MSYRHRNGFVCGIAIIVIACLAQTPQLIADTFSFQGKLTDAGQPESGPVNFAFRLYDDEVDGVQIGSELLLVGFTGFGDAGEFTVDLDFGDGAFPGSERWLEVWVNGAPLSPRQQVNPTPYALHAQTAATVSDGGLPLAYAEQVDFSNPLNTYTGNGSGLLNLNASALAGGVVPSSVITGTYSNAVEFTNGTFSGDGAGLANLDATSIATGTINAARLPGGGAWLLSNPLNIGGPLFLIDPTSNKVEIGGTASGSQRLLVVGEALDHNAKAFSARMDDVGTSFAGEIVAVDGFINLDGPTDGGSGARYAGVRGVASGNRGHVGVYGKAVPSIQLSVPSRTGVLGETSDGYGVIGFNSAPGKAAVWGKNHYIFGSEDGIGVRGTARSDQGIGVLAECEDTNGINYALRANTPSPNGYAGYFEGGRNYFEGNIGVGTTSPTTRLAVHGDEPSNPLVEVFNDNDAPSTLRFSTPFHDWMIGQNRPPDSPGSDLFFIYDETDARTRLSINPTGGFGIGTPAPAADLHVRGVGSLGSMLLTPEDANSNSEIFMAEQQAKSFGMILRYDGSSNQLHIVAQQSFIETAPLVSINRSSSGNVGIGTTSPGAFRLAVNGSAAKLGGGSWSVFSDARLKRDIEPIESGMLDRLLSLRGYTFVYLNDAVQNRLALPGRQTGLIAQDVAEVFPDWVDADDDGFLYITERGATAMLIEALRELRAEKDRQVAERDMALGELQLEFDQLLTANAAMEQRLGDVETLMQHLLHLND